MFLSVLTLFHGSEYVLTFIFNKKDLSWKSLLISRPYCLAMTAACIEYAIERLFVPGLKLPVVSKLGIAAVTVGEGIRKTAMVTAKGNFTHLIQFKKKEGHELVTHGIYRWVRHPGYLGWFIWAVGTQLLLVNPICTLAFILTIWRFFKVRVAVEEEYLSLFFGRSYNEYQSRIPSGIPFIK